MFQRIAKRICSYLSNKGILNEENKDIYIYALEVIILNTSIFVSLFVISVMMKHITSMVCFILFFVPIRIYGGGYHAKKSITCFLLSITSYVLALSILNSHTYLYLNRFIQVSLVCVIIMMYIFAPIVNENHPLDDKQYKRNKTIVRLLLIIDFIVLVFVGINENKYCSSIMIFVLLNGVFFLLGKVEQYVLYKKTKI